MKAVLVVMLALAWPSLPAHASHYRLPVPRLMSDVESEAFRHEGIKTTQALLTRVAKKAGRLRLARATGLALERVERLATELDLLRIEGVGPSMVLVLQAAGFRDSRALAATDASTLAAAMRAANERDKIASVLPLEPSLHAWILEARQLPAVLDGL